MNANSAEVEVLDRLKKAVIEGRSELSKKAAEDALSLGIDPMIALKKGLLKGMGIVGDKFGAQEMFLTEVMFSADAMKAGMEVLKSEMEAKEIAETRLGTIIIGTVKGDIHDIGKNIVIALLEAAGFKVHDIGIDIPPNVFVEKAEEVNADIIAASALLTTTIPYMEDIASLLRDTGLRGKFKFIVGGSQVTPGFAEEIGADGYGKDAGEAVGIAKKLLGLK